MHLAPNSRKPPPETTTVLLQKLLRTPIGSASYTYHWGKKHRSSCVGVAHAPVLRFPLLGASSFLSFCSFGAPALCFPMLRGRPWPSFASLEVLFFRFGAPALYMSIRGAVLFRSWASSWVALGCLLGGRVRSGPVDGSWLSKKAFPCSVALVLFKNKRSHAAWRSFF